MIILLYYSIIHTMLLCLPPSGIFVREIVQRFSSYTSLHDALSSQADSAPRRAILLYTILYYVILYPIILYYTIYYHHYHYYYYYNIYIYIHISIHLSLYISLYIYPSILSQFKDSPIERGSTRLCYYFRFRSHGGFQILEVYI